MDYSWEDISPYNVIVNTTGMDARAYQINILKSIYAGRNTLVVLPTGLGKTLIAVFAISKSLYEGKKALMLAPTRPLSEQHYDSLLKLLKINATDIFLATGSVRGSKRQELESASRVVVATPQTIYNDMIKGRLSLSDFGIVIFDECHKAVGKYSYTYIANECKERGIQVLGLTASPGSDQKRIRELVAALGIEKIEARSSLDEDVSPYVMGTSTRTVYVEKSEPIKAITAVLKPVIDEHLHNLYKIGMSPFKEFEHMPKGKLIEIGNNISKIEAKNYRFNAMFNYVYLLNLVHAYDLISTEGIYPFLSYFESLQSREKKSRSLESMLKNAEVKKAIDIARRAADAGEEHPKMWVIADMLRQQGASKSTIIFAQYRSTIKKLVDVLNGAGISAMAFVGKNNGVTQEMQSSTLEKFRSGQFKVLVASSIGEEGLDIPSVDMVIFYEPIPSAIRNIQRKGRTGRFRFGEVMIMVTRGTKDEAYLMVSRLKEKRMFDILRRMGASMDRNPYDQSQYRQKKL